MGTSVAEPASRKEGSAEKDPDFESRLFRHKKRPQWGVAILAWEKENHRAYQFEDGRLRKFKDGYYGLMEPAENVKGSRAAIVEGLNTAIEANKGKASPKPQKAVAPFEAQIELFEKLFPEGFDDPEWISQHRRGDGRALKRHREPVAEAVQKQLAQDVVDELLAEGHYDDVTASVLEQLGRTTLVPLKVVKTLDRLDEEERRTFAESVRDLLHGEDEFMVRFKRYLATLRDLLGGRPSWRLATALPALMWPDEHVCVRRSAFIRQAGSIAPMAKYTKRARTGSYRNFRRVALAVQKRLEDAGHAPRDLLDVHDFIWATLRKSALEHVAND